MGVVGVETAAVGNALRCEVSSRQKNRPKTTLTAARSPATLWAKESQLASVPIAPADPPINTTCALQFSVRQLLQFFYPTGVNLALWESQKYRNIKNHKKLMQS